MSLVDQPWWASEGGARKIVKCVLSREIQNDILVDIWELVSLTVLNHAIIEYGRRTAWAKELN